MRNLCSEWSAATVRLSAPGAFLDVAEKYGLITEIDQWVVRLAARRAAAGHHVGAHLSAESMLTLDLVA
jgi:EAL domain-containing protein (putative c-di-GMP-specific phosphodiesterase class I)